MPLQHMTVRSRSDAPQRQDQVKKQLQASGAASRPAHAQAGRTPREFQRERPGPAAQYYVSALLGLLTWWLDSERPYAPDEMDAMFRRLVLPTLRGD